MTEERKCTGVCYQRYVDMFNEKDKECFNLALKYTRTTIHLAYIQSAIEQWQKDLENNNILVCREGTKIVNKIKDILDTYNDGKNTTYVL